MNNNDAVTSDTKDLHEAHEPADSSKLGFEYLSEQIDDEAHDVNTDNNENPATHSHSIVFAGEIKQPMILEALSLAYICIELLSLFNVRPFHKGNRHHEQSEVHQVHIQGIHHGSCVVKLILSHMDVLFLFLDQLSDLSVLTLLIIFEVRISR